MLPFWKERNLLGLSWSPHSTRSCWSKSSTSGNAYLYMTSRQEFQTLPGRSSMLLHTEDFFFDKCNFDRTRSPWSVWAVIRSCCWYTSLPLFLPLCVFRCSVVFSFFSFFFWSAGLLFLIKIVRVYLIKVGGNLRYFVAIEKDNCTFR